jgi:GTP-binding protein
MKIDAEFVTSAAGAGDFPRDRLPEVALVGRSNVGKSSLLNALARRPVARTSAAPGKTRLANFYRVQRGSAPALHLVDLPGYGYARAPRPATPLGAALSGPKGRQARGGSNEGEDRRRHHAGQFEPLIEAYFSRPGARAVLMLVDSRHPGLPADRDTWAWLETLPCPRGIVGTKVDKLTRAERTRNARELELLFDAPVLLVSVVTGEGLDELWKMIARLPSQTAA